MSGFRPIQSEALATCAPLRLGARNPLAVFSLFCEPPETRAPSPERNFDPIVNMLLQMTAPKRSCPLPFMRVDDLVNVLRRNGLSLYGTRADLIERIERNETDVVRALFKEPEIPLTPNSTFELVLAAVSQNGLELRNAPSFNDNETVVWAAVQNFSMSLKFASPGFKADKANGLKAVRIDGHCLQFLSRELRQDKEIMLAAVENKSEALQWTLHPDDEVVERALACPGYGNLIKFANQTQLGYPDEKGVVHLRLARIAVENSGDGLAVLFLSPFARRELRFVAVRAQGNALKNYTTTIDVDELTILDPLCHDRALVQIAVAQDGHALRYASAYLRGDAAIVGAAVRQNPYAIMYACESIKHDPELALLAAEQSSDALLQANIHDFQALHELAVNKAKAYAYAAFVAFREGASAWKVEGDGLRCKKANASFARRLSAHNPYFFKLLTGLIGAFLGDPTGEKTKSLGKSARNLI
jgi:hypothetical protein